MLTGRRRPAASAQPLTSSPWVRPLSVPHVEENITMPLSLESAPLYVACLRLMEVPVD